MNRLNTSTGFAICLIAVSTLMAQGPPSQRPQTPTKPEVKLPQHPTSLPQEVKKVLGYELGIDSVQRSGPPPATLFVPTPSSVIYDSTPVIVSFTFSNSSGRPVTGRITGNFGGPNFGASSPVKSLAPRSSLQATLVLGNPPSAGTQTVKLVYQESRTSAPIIEGPVVWETKASANQPITVIRAPQYVPRAPYDLVYESGDDNGFPLNPRWGKQDKYFFDTGSRDLWNSAARPDILLDCYNHAEHQDFNGINNDYDGFRNGYCKHSPGATNLNAFFCQGDREVSTQPGGPIYCSSFAWKDTPWAGKCGGLPGDMNDINGDGGFVITFHNSGHENFGVVTYDGIVNWDNAQPEYFFDSDWCIDLYTPHGAGVTGRKPIDNFVHTELDPHNVGDDWDHGFWGNFNKNIHDAQGGECCGGFFQYSQAVVSKENQTVAPLINGHRAIVIGLLGLDLGHNDASSELHPVYGMAIHTGGRPLAGSACRAHDDASCQDTYLHPEHDRHFDVPQNPNDDTWEIFATNFGNEGYCSTRALHNLDGPESIIGRNDFPTMIFRLPWANDESGFPMADAVVLDSTNFTRHSLPGTGNNVATVDTFVEKGKDIAVTFHMLPSGAQSNSFGEVHIQWTRSSHPLIEHLPPVILSHAVNPAAESSRAKEESHPVAASLTETQQKAFAAAAAKTVNVTPPPRRVSVEMTRRVAPPPPPPPPVQPRVQTVKGSSARGVEEEEAFRRGMCAAHNGHVPNFPPDFCQQSPR